MVECWNGTFRDHGIACSSETAKAAYTNQLKLAMSGAHDIVHVHHATESYHPDVLAFRTVPLMWTDHNAVHNDGKPEIFSLLAELDIGLTALSESHRGTVPNANWLATIHHGLPIGSLTPTGAAPTYLAFLGRISPEKGITTAVQISEAGGFELKVAAKVDKVDRAFYEVEVQPLFAASNVDFIGEISEAEKGPFLSAAIALIFPISWLEPFGLVMIEAMACGCPIIAFRMGSVSEIVEHGITGFIVDTEEEAVQALQHIGSLDRTRIRQRFEERFTSIIMAHKYVDVYGRVIDQAKAKQLEKSSASRAVNTSKHAGILAADHYYSPLQVSLPVEPFRPMSATPNISTPG
jgi:glycosyltransferase involved in cell wall biosynthesis